MKKLVFVIFVLCFSVSLFAQGDYSKTTAVSFSFNGLNLGSFYGGVGGRTWLSETTVLNVNIGGTISEQEYEKTDVLDKGLNKTKRLNLGVGIEKHFSGSTRLSPYYSFRLSIGLTDSYHRSSNSTSENAENKMSYNFDFGMGLEYWLDKSISITGQHLFTLGYKTGSRSFWNGVSNQSQDLKEFNIGTGTTSIILSIYF
ncbi:MAG: hypothetical protein K9J16_14440 [Melioribacteraceae bacterium]|nr:hypothetical protein [Melioribacteraceae bacterium]MCF8354455.1 hypothetical protein [Melioribacteraceae bacterium]MCF8394065.1 hypothetical protein [Melioribacteraceae bacterium]MCF8419831.1 hypothetical protein [Melioribacteraceae bacterium]